MSRFDRTRRKPNKTLVVVLSVLGVMVLLCGGVSAAALVWTKRTVEGVQKRLKAEEEAHQKDPKTKVYGRDEFRSMLMGKTENEVLDAVGRPTNTRDGSWTYDDRTRDPITGKTGLAFVRFDSDKRVVRVDY